MALGIFLLSLAAVPAQEAIDCRPVLEQLRKNVSSAPTHVLTLLEDALIANGGHCVGAFVQTAIEASQADAATVKKIVFVAVTTSPKQAPEIAESAVAAAPKHADSVRAAFAEAFDDKNPRMKPADPAPTPAWEVAASPVAPPAPAPASPGGTAAGRTAAPPVAANAGRSAQAAAVPPRSPAAAAPASPAAPAGTGDPGTVGNPYVGIDGQATEGDWKLFHDGVVEGAGAPQPAAGTPAEVVPPPPLEETPAVKKGLFGLRPPSWPSLPPVDQPVDLFFRAPFGGIPGPDQGS